MVRNATSWFTRRRIAVVLAMLLCLGTVIGWKLAYRRDSRLIGKWSVVINSRLNSEWTFDTDGTGSAQLAPDPTAGSIWKFHWWTTGDRLYLNRRSGWDQLHNVADALSRREIPRLQTDDYWYMFHGADEIRVGSHREQTLQVTDLTLCFMRSTER